MKICGILAKKPQPCERILVEQVPGYRPQAKGNVERQVSVVKQAFWSNWLEVEAKLSISSQTEKLPLACFGGCACCMLDEPLICT